MPASYHKPRRRARARRRYRSLRDIAREADLGIGLLLMMFIVMPIYNWLPTLGVNSGVAFFVGIAVAASLVGLAHRYWG